nr:hypothetical protein [Tanacetum cinerariifolium]
MNPWGGNAAGYGEAQNRIRNVNQGQARPGQDKTAQENREALDAEHLLFLAGGPDNAFDDDVDEQPVQDLALNVDNVFQAEDYDAFDSDVDEAPTSQTMFMANFSSADPITDESGPSYDSDILSEAQDHDQYLDHTCAYQEEHVMHDSVQLDHAVDLHVDYTSVSNMIPYDHYVKDNDVSVVHSNASSILNDTFMMIYDDMCEPFAPSVSNSSQNAVVKNSLTAELATYREQVELAENDKVKQHYKQLYNSIKITRAKNIEQVTKLTAKNVTLKTSVSKAKVQPSVLTRTKHAVDVKLIVPRLRNNRNAHLDYLRNLKESVEIIRDIIEEAKVVRPLDRSIVSACRYTQHSQELLEYAIGTCPRGSQQRAKQLAHTLLIRKKQVTATKPSDRQDSNKNKHVVTQKIQKTNVPVPYSTGVKCCPKASGSQPKSNHKTNWISPAKGANKLPVEDLPRTNKSHLRTTNHIDSSSRITRT